MPEYYTFRLITVILHILHMPRTRRRTYHFRYAWHCEIVRSTPPLHWNTLIYEISSGGRIETISKPESILWYIRPREMREIPCAFRRPWYVSSVSASACKTNLRRSWYCCEATLENSPRDFTRGKCRRERTERQCSFLRAERKTTYICTE